MLGLVTTSANPFIKTDLFTTTFASHPAVEGYTMQQLIDGVQDNDASKLEDAARKAARTLVAAHLDATLYGPGYGYSQVQLETMWQQATIANTEDAFQVLKATLEATYN